jgi:hypothetical protein
VKQQSGTAGGRAHRSLLRDSGQTSEGNRLSSS